MMVNYYISITLVTVLPHPTLHALLPTTNHPPIRFLLFKYSINA